jgi:serine/threonine protein kinase
VLKVEGREPRYLILRWMTELSNATTWLESLRYAHGDIRPLNLLLDSKDHLKLADFDNTAIVSTTSEVGIAPYARVLGNKGGD